MRRWVVAWCSVLTIAGCMAASVGSQTEENVAADDCSANARRPRAAGERRCVRKTVVEVRCTAVKSNELTRKMLVTFKERAMARQLDFLVQRPEVQLSVHVFDQPRLPASLQGEIGGLQFNIIGVNPGDGLVDGRPGGLCRAIDVARSAQTFSDVLADVFEEAVEPATNAAEGCRYRTVHLDLGS